MRPTHINIVGKSKFVFNREIQPQLRGRFQDLIKKISVGSKIILSDKVNNADDVEVLVGFLMKKGIPRTDIRLRYPAETGEVKLSDALRKGVYESGLSFGEDVAERDSGLSRYFITTRAYMELSAQQKHIVNGPKGSGKSALLSELNSNEDLSIVITPEHYASDVLNAMNDGKMAGDLSAYITTWKYTLLIEIFRRLVAKQHGGHKALSDLRRYLVSHGQLEDNLTMLERFLSYLRRITQIKGKLGPVNGELGIQATDELGKLLKMDELLGLIPSLKIALRKNKFIVFIDELDQSWNNTENANNFLVSLLTAAIQLRGISENLHIIVFLRSEIFDLLKPYLPQLDKLRSDIVDIRWSNRELKNLIISRALDSLSIDEDVNADSAIKTIFTDKIEPEGVHCFDYILSRTSYRPREVIQLCNLALQEAVSLDISSISTDACLRAEEIFSDWKKDHIVSENMYIYPRLDGIIEFFRGKSRKLTYNAIDSLLSEIILQSDNNEDIPDWVNLDVEPVDLLRLLYKLEIIGIEKPNLAITDSNISIDYYDFAYSRPAGKPESSHSFLFHPGIWKSLEMN